MSALVSTPAPRQAVLPRSLLACLPCLWSQVLFPGHISIAGRPRLVSLLILLVLPAVLLYPCMGFHLFEPDEGRYAEIPREMLARGDWIVPHLQNAPYLDKPPLFYWLVMGSYAIFGVHDWAARLVPALAIHITILLVYLLGRRSLGERPAFWGALLLGLAPGFLSIGRLLVLDGLLALWVTLSLLSGFEAIRGERFRWSWWLVAATACGLGILTKGPVALVLFLPPLLAHGWLADRRQIGWHALGVLAGVVLLLTLPWYVAVCCRMPEFARHFFWQHHVVRYFAPFDHQRPFWFYVPIVLLGLLPGILLLPALVRWLLASDDNARRQRTPALGFALLSAGWCLLFFSLSGCKLPTYIMPAFPPLALALGCFLGERWTRRPIAPAVLAGLAFVMLGAGHFVALPWYAQFRSPMSRSEQVRHYCADRKVPVVCYPRNCDSVGFYLQRDDLVTFRGKDINSLIAFLQGQPRAVVLFTHRHSKEALRLALPPTLCMAEELPLFDSARATKEGLYHLLKKAGLVDTTRDSTDGLCYMAVVTQTKK